MLTVDDTALTRIPDERVGEERYAPSRLSRIVEACVGRLQGVVETRVGLELAQDVNANLGDPAPVGLVVVAGRKVGVVERQVSRAIEKCRLIAIEKCRSVAIVESTLKLRSIEPGGQARRSAKC